MSGQAEGSGSSDKSACRAARHAKMEGGRAYAGSAAPVAYNR